jgi:threonine dehydrogenase-like Zn-dependent dehydrogenase
VTAIDVWADKAQEAHALGATEFLTFDQATAGAAGSFDLLVNCASANVSTPALLALLRSNGSLVQLGIPGGRRLRGWRPRPEGAVAGAEAASGCAACCLQLSRGMDSEKPASC